MERDEINAKARDMAAKGIDARTIAFHLEEVLGRRLKSAELVAVQDGAAAGAKARRAARGKTGAVTAEEVRRRTAATLRRTRA